MAGKIQAFVWFGLYFVRFLLKGQCQEMDILFEGLNTIFCVCADGFQGLSKAFHYPLQLLTF